MAAAQNTKGYMKCSDITKKTNQKNLKNKMYKKNPTLDLCQACMSACMRACCMGSIDSETSQVSDL